MYSSLIKKALYFSAKKHDGQYRKGGQRVPYIAHPALIAFGVRSHTDDEEIIASALLHDILEDCPEVTISELQREFGDRVASLVDEVSLVGSNTYKNWKSKKEAYLEKIQNASDLACIIIAVDKMYNFKSYFDTLQNSPDNPPVGFAGSVDEYRWYYSRIGDILSTKLPEHSVVKEYLRLWSVYKK